MAPCVPFINDKINVNHININYSLTNEFVIVFIFPITKKTIIIQYLRLIASIYSTIYWSIKCIFNF